MSGGAIASFDFGVFSARYPELVPVGSTLAQEYWNEAALFLANDGTGPVSSPAVQQQLLNMVTAHLAFLFAPRDASGNPAATGAGPPKLVGRISSATQGSVTVAADYADSTTAQEAFFQQSRYGVEFWTLTAVYRMAFYRPSPRAFRRPRFTLGGRLLPWN